MKQLIPLFLAIMTTGCGSGCNRNNNPTRDGNVSDTSSPGDTSSDTSYDAPANGDTSTPVDANLPSDLLRPEDLQYRGAFRVPEDTSDDDRRRWGFGGQAFAYRPDGDSGGGSDGYPGSLIGAGHDLHLWVSEISIPEPRITRNVQELPVARTLQPFAPIDGGLYDTLNEMPHLGLEYMPAGAGRSGAYLYQSRVQHFQEEGSPERIPSHARSSLDFASPNVQGTWWIGQESPYCTGAYLFSIPTAWAQEHVGGRALITGRFRDGGWSGMGPSIYAIAPWLEGNPPSSGARLDSTVLLHYSRTNIEGQRFGINDYQHSDEWQGGAWIITDNRTAVIFAGTKGSGYNWYGWSSAADDGMPCIDGHITDSQTCYTPERGGCPENLTHHCDGADERCSRGWWSSRFDAQIIFYNPEDFARVADGDMEPYEPQPYATLDIDQYLYLPADTGDVYSTSVGNQRRFRIGETTYDSARRILYVPERFGDESRPIIHVFAVQ